ncbi:helix-turn-helix domain-containing protein [Coraliomargarita parva]|uniref:helix-turn-helix domain-containing protein n=1 Tax=Coraliomargarita parva TaxID=3014050 RepID=UPI0022B5DCF9|nr:AraC family transcriptional regulator [Coraliomargarita parva]
MLTNKSAPLRYLDWNNLRFQLLWIYEGSPSSNVRQVRHALPGLSAWWVRKGSVSIQGGGEEVTGLAGDWVFPPFEGDQRSFSPDFQFVSLRFMASWTEDREAIQEEVPRKCSAEDYPKLERATHKLMKISGKKMLEAKNQMQFVTVKMQNFLSIQCAFLEWIQIYFRVMEDLGAQTYRLVTTDDRVNDAKTYLERAPIDHPMREQDVAKVIGISVAQLNRLFVKDMGMTPCGYFNRRKEEHAKKMLVQTSTPIKRIGYELGFNDPANFTNWFQSKTGQSPKAYRKAILES